MMKLKLVAAAVMAVGISSMANANIIVPSTSAGIGNLGGSELVFNMFDGVNTYSLDLGVTMGTAAAPGANIPVNVNLFAADPKASLFFTANGVLRQDVRWGVMAADSQASAPGTTSAANLGQRILTTSTAATWTYTNANTTASAGALNSFISNLNFLPDHLNTVNGSDVSTNLLDGASWQGSGMLGSWAQNNRFTALQTGSGSLQFVQVAQRFNQNPTTGAFSTSTTLPAIFSTVGQFTLAANGQLTFAPVPVPAAVWLFGSALMGLVGVARRRKEMV